MSAEAIAALLEALITEGVHLLDPAERAKTIRQRVDEEVARWAALDPGSVAARASAIESAALRASAKALRPMLSGPGLPLGMADAISVLVDHHDPQPAP